MTSLRKFLKEKGYVRIPLIRINTNHYKLEASINGVRGDFILDTGASNTCIEISAKERFFLKAKDSEIKAAGAGGGGLHTQLSKKNHVQIGKWERKRNAIILFNMAHVNTALEDHDAQAVDGIIGADILKRSKAIIDYDKSCVYLKK